MKKFEASTMSVKSMSETLGGGDITHDTTILWSRKTRQKACQLMEDETTEITGTITIVRKK